MINLQAILGSLRQQIPQTPPSSTEGLPRTFRIRPGDDVQGLNLVTNPVNRESILANIQIYSVFNRGRGFTRPSHEHLGLEEGPVLELERKFVWAERFTKLDDIVPSHFQLHHNFRVLSPKDFLYPGKQGLIHFDRANNNHSSMLRVSSITCVDHCDDLVACSHMDEEITIFDMNNPGQVIARFPISHNHDPVNFVRFLDNPNTGALKLMVAGNYRYIRLIDLNEGIRDELNLEVRANANHFSFDSTRNLALFGYDATKVDIWDLRSKSRAHYLEGHLHHTYATAWHDNDFYVASGNQDLTTIIWDLRMNKAVDKINAFGEPAGSIKFLQNSKLLAIGDYSNVLRVYDTQNYQLYSEVPYIGSLCGFDTLDNGKTLSLGVASHYNEMIPGGVIDLKLSLTGPEIKPSFNG